MKTVMEGGVVLAIAVLLTLLTLTSVGARRRGSGWPVAVVEGIFFPITWSVWYLRDEHPYRRSLHRA